MEYKIVIPPDMGGNSTMHQVPPTSGGITIYLLTAVIDNADLNYSLQITSDLQEFIEEQQVAAPFIIEYGSDFYVTVEKELYEVDSFVESLCILFAIYYVFDIAYTNGCANTLLVLEKTVLKISSGLKLPKSVLGTVSDILK